MSNALSLFLPRFADRRILVVGDLMIDEYLWGGVDRISPEAPVQVVSVEREEFVLGGAGNVASNLKALGASVAIAGVIGGGEDGRRLLELFGRLGVDAAGVVTEPGRRTTRKTRVIASHQHVLRIDRETRRHIAPDSIEKLAAFARGAAAKADALLVSDYDKGLLTPGLLQEIIAAGRDAGIPVIVDPKGLDFSKYRGASLITPNKKEASFASGQVVMNEETLARAAAGLMEAVEADRILVTCGPEGMVLFERGGGRHRIEARARQIYDVSGAGDTVISVLGLAVASGASWLEATALANAAAGVVVGKVGTATLSVGELETALAAEAGGVILKEKKLSDIAAHAAELRRQDRRVVLTNGCFDLLHAGHIRLFTAARALGDYLVVAIDDDASVRKLKGPGRPVIGERERVRILSALSAVDAVVVFSTDRLLDLIEKVKPDVLAKGDNYRREDIVGRDVVERRGGKVVRIPMEADHSSTRIIEAIRNGG